LQGKHAAKIGFKGANIDFVLVRRTASSLTAQGGTQYHPTMNEKYLERAMLITKNFERHDSWPNITGNFNGEGLTCGQLGHLAGKDIR
jgi:hypothetical protein